MGVGDFIERLDDSIEEGSLVVGDLLAEPGGELGAVAADQGDRVVVETRQCA